MERQVSLEILDQIRPIFAIHRNLGNPRRTTRFALPSVDEQPNGPLEALET